jgi:hypothetical protein
MVRQRGPIPQKTYGLIKRLKTPEEVEKYFPEFVAFIDLTESSKYQDRQIRVEEEKCIIL